MDSRDLVRRLCRQYLDEEISLRSMATEAGLECREVYALLEELALPIT